MALGVFQAPKSLVGLSASVTQDDFFDDLDAPAPPWGAPRLSPTLVRGRCLGFRAQAFQGSP